VTGIHGDASFREQAGRPPVLPAVRKWILLERDGWPSETIPRSFADLSLVFFGKEWDEMRKGGGFY
jgi:hypothetical protein